MEHKPKETVIYCGWVEILQGFIIKTWQRRWLVLTNLRVLRIQNPEKSRQNSLIDLENIIHIQPSLWVKDSEHALDLLNASHVVMTFRTQTGLETETWREMLSNKSDNDFMCTKEGFMTKRGGFVKNWKKRYFVLISGVLYYFTDIDTFMMFKQMKTSAKMPEDAHVLCRGTIDLNGAKVKPIKGMMENYSNVFRIECPKRTYFITAPTHAEKDDWIGAIAREIEALKVDISEVDDWTVLTSPRNSDLQTTVNEVHESLSGMEGSDVPLISSTLSQILNPGTKKGIGVPSQETSDEKYQDELEFDDSPLEVKTSNTRGIEMTSPRVTKDKDVSQDNAKASKSQIIQTTEDLSGEVNERTVVIDAGSGFIKAGLCGGDMPKTMFQTVIGRPKYNSVLKLEDEEEKLFVGRQAINSRGVLSLNYPIKNGIVRNWDEMESLLRYTFSTELQINPEDHPVLLTESPLNPKKERERMVQILFETFNVPAAYIALQSVLSLYALGKTTGIVLDIGDGVSHVTPVYEGYSIPYAIERMNVAGRNITEYLSRLLCDRGYFFSTSAEMDVARDIKEKLCYVSQDFTADVNCVPEKIEATYNLPDGQTIQVFEERIKCTEALFQPAHLGMEHEGVHSLVHKSIMKCDIDIRKELYSSIILSGGSSMFPGLPERLHSEVNTLIAHDMKIKVTSTPNRKILVWLGGSVLSSLEQFRTMWITREEYDETGVRIVHRKCL